MRKSLVSYSIKLGVTLVTMFVILQFVLVPTKIVMTSMYPTLDDGQYVFINTIPYRMQEPARGDIVVFSREFTDERLIKRIIGLPGECIQFRNGQCYINHKLFVENEDKNSTDYSQIFPVVYDHQDCLILKDNQYYVMGDNRPVSLDSRSFGPIEKKSIIGKLLFKTPFGDK